MSAIAAQLKTLLTSEPDPTKKYFAITLLCSADGKKIAYSCYSHWVGFTEDAPRKEIREASIVHADRVVELWREMGETAIVVNSLDDMSLFFAFGGNGVIEEGVARSVIGEWLATVVVASVGQYGFTAIDTLPPGALNKAPTPKHRMRVLKRDNFRCRICGRSASDHVDLELHVHHIRPWAAGE